MKKDFSISNVDKTAALDLATEIASLDLSAAMKLLNFKELWRNGTSGSGINFNNKTVLEFRLNKCDLKRFLVVRDGNKWGHIWYRNNNHMGDFGYVRIYKIADKPVEDKAYVGYASATKRGKKKGGPTPYRGWYFSKNLRNWVRWNNGKPDLNSQTYTGNQLGFE